MQKSKEKEGTLILVCYAIGFTLRQCICRYRLEAVVYNACLVLPMAKTHCQVVVRTDP